jgi:hypothetical protein
MRRFARLGWCYNAAGREKDALAALTKAAELCSPGSAQGYSYRAAADGLAGNRRSSLVNLERCLAQDPADSWLKRHLAEVYRAIGGSHRALGDGQDGITVDHGGTSGTTDVVIGGTDAGSRNVISGNGHNGIAGADGSQVIVQGNYIGTDVNGAPTLGNGDSGISSSANWLIGGTAAGAGNLIAGNCLRGGAGITLGSSNELVQGNVIREHYADGVDIAPWVPPAWGNTVSQNAIYGNTELGINIVAKISSDPDGVTLNDSMGHDGTNHFQNFPVLTGLTSPASGITVTGTLTQSVTPNTSFRIEFFANHEADPSGYGEGERYIGSIDVTTDDNGIASFTAPLDALRAGEEFITATATNLATGDTSECSKDVGAAVATLTSSATPSPFGQPVTFTATLSAAAGSATPTGSVDFVDTTTNTDLGTVALSGGTASKTISSLSGGTHVIEALYGGDGTFLATNASITQIVNATPSVAVTDAGGTYNGNQFPATATVAGMNGIAGSSLENVGLTLDYEQLDDSGNAIADLGSSAPLHAGNYEVIASFAGSTDYSSAQNSTTFTIGKANQTVTWATPAPILYGTALSSTQLDATVSVIGPAPAGAVTYSPTAGTVLGPGFQTLTVTAAATNDYNQATASVSLQVEYAFSGFLPPLSKGLVFAANRTIPIKFTLSDANGKAITSLNAVTSLQIQALDANGNPVGAPFNPASTNNQGLQNTGGQYLFNWQTKGLSAGSYQIELTLADGTTQSKTIQIAAGGSSAGLVTGSSGGTATAGALLGGEADLYVDNSNGDLTSDELARIQDAVTSIDATIAPYGVVINEVSDPTQANVTLNMNTTSALGGTAQGVLGCTTDADQVTMIQGWNWYAGSDPTQVGAGQYDFETAVVHELGHVLGLGHSSGSTSVMYASLATGTANRVLTTADVNVPDDDSGPCALHAASAAAMTGTSNSQSVSVPSSTSIASRIPGSGSPMSAAGQWFANDTLVLNELRNGHQPAWSSVAALRQSIDALALQRLDRLLSMEAGAMAVTKDTLRSELFFASLFSPNGV